MRAPRVGRARAETVAAVDGRRWCDEDRRRLLVHAEHQRRRFGLHNTCQCAAFGLRDGCAAERGCASNKGRSHDAFHGPIHTGLPRGGQFQHKFEQPA